MIYAVQSWYARREIARNNASMPCQGSRVEGGAGDGKRVTHVYPGLIVAFTSAVQPEKRIERKRGGRGKNPRFPGSRLDSFAFPVMRKRSPGFRQFTRQLTTTADPLFFFSSFRPNLDIRSFRCASSILYIRAS